MAVNKTAAGTFAADFRGPECNCGSPAGPHRHRIQKTFETHKEAANFQKDALAQVAKREYVKPSDTKVREIAAQWLQKKKEGRYERSTLESWNNHIEHYIIPELGSLNAHDCPVERIEMAAEKWAKAVAPQTVNKMLTTLTAIFAMAKRYKVRNDNPAAEAERLKLATEDEDGEVVQPDEVYNKDELKKLIQVTEPGSRERIAIMIPIFTGARIGEELAASWPAIDLKAAKFSVRLSLADSAKGEEPIFKAPKSKSSRRILDLPQELVRELKVWKLRCPNSTRELVLATEEGKPMHRKAISKILDGAIVAAKLEKRLTPHGLRHSFASLLLSEGADIAEVARLMGHKKPSTTLNIYTHFVNRETKSIQNLASSIMG